MSKTVDERVVSMQFDNAQFERNVSTSMSTLEKLKQSLNLSGASKGLENIRSAADKVDFSGMSNGISVVQAKFSHLQATIQHQLNRIVDSAVNAGKRLVSAFTIEPVKMGLSEYETQINAVQTILANTQSKGTTLDQVNTALDELNRYADMTIYNFTEMTRNIGTFTAAGVDLDTSVQAIKGIANLAAVSGSNSQQASTAMYQLSQALASGTVKLMDWNSVVNAGMGGQVFQDALKETARVHGINIDKMIEKEGSFRETLSNGWLSSEILTETLAKFTGDLTDEQLRSMGYTEEQIVEIQKLGKTANDAATKVKTFTQLMDTLKEAAQSGWTQTWEILIGDFEEAKELWTNVSDIFSEMINSSAEARNNMLQGWKDKGGRTMAIEALKNAFDGLMSIIKPIKEAFREIFPPITSDQLLKFTERIKDLTAKFILTDDQAKKLKSAFKGLFSGIKIGIDFIKAIVSGIGKLLGHFKGLGGVVLDIAASWGDWLTKIKESVDSTNIFSVAIGKVTDILGIGIDRIKEFIKAIGSKIKAPGFEWIINIAKSIGKVFATIAKAIGNLFTNGSIEGVIKTFNAAIFSGILLKLSDFIGGFKEAISDFGGFKSGITDILDGVKSSLEAFQSSLKAETIKKIAIAIGILALSLVILSLIDPEKLSNALVAMTGLFAELMGSFYLFGKIGKTGVSGVGKAATLMIAMSASVLILSFAMKKLASLEWEGIAKGLVAIGALMAEISIFLRTAKFDGKLKRTAVGIVILSAAMLILAEAVKNFGALSWTEIGKGLTAIGALLLEISLFTKLTGNAKKVVSTGIAMVLFGASMKIFASAMKDMAKMSWGEMAKGLVTMAGALTAVTIAMRLMPKNMVSKSLGLIGVGAALLIIGKAVQKMGSMSWKEIARGLTALAGSLTAIAIAMNIMPKNMAGRAVGLIIVSMAMNILAKALDNMSGMSWEGIAKGLVSLGGSLGIIAVGLKMMNGTLAGSAALIVAAMAFAVFAPILKMLGSMQLKEVGVALLALAGVFVIFGIAAAVLKPLIPAMYGIAGAVLLLGAGCALAGFGVLALAAGISALAGSLVAVGSSIVSTIAVIIQGLGEIIVSTCQAIVAAAPSIAEAFISLITAGCKAIKETIPLLAETFLELILNVLQSLEKFIPQIADSLFNVIIKLFDKLAERMPELVNSALNLLGSFFSALGDALGGKGQFENLLSSIECISEVFLALSAAAFILSKIPITGALVAAANMGILIGAISVILTALGGLKQIPGFEWIIGEGSKILGQIGTAIGTFVGNIIGSFGVGITSGLPQIGENLSGFMTNVRDFVDGIKTVDSTVLGGAANLAGAVLAITAADVISGLTSWLTGGSSIVSFGEDIAKFGPYMKQFADSVAGIDSASVQGAANAAKSLAEMTNMIPSEGGIKSWFVGETSIAKYGSELISLGVGLKGFALATAGINGENLTGVIDAAKSLAEMTNMIPNEGGIKSWFTGNTAIAKYGNDLIMLGIGLKGFSMVTAGINGEALTGVINAAKSLAEMTSMIPNEGGIKAWFTGESAISKYSSDLISLGIGLKTFSIVTSGINSESLIGVINAAKALSEMTNMIPNEGGVKAWFVGESAISKYGSDLIMLGVGLKGFSVVTSGIVPENLSGVISAAKSIVNMTSAIPTEGGVKAWFGGETAISKYGSDLIMLGVGLKGFSMATAGIVPENLSGVISAAKSLVEMTNTIPSEGGLKAWFSGEKSVASFGGKLPELGKGIKGFSDSVKGIDPSNVTSAANAAKTLAEMSETVPKNTKKIVSFGENLKKFGSHISDYFDNTKNISDEDRSSSNKTVRAIRQIQNIDSTKITSASTSIKQLSSAMKELSKIKSGSADGFAQALTKLGESGIDSFVSAFGDSGKISNATSSVKDLINTLTSSINDKKDSFKIAAKGLMDAFISGIKNTPNTAYSSFTKACRSMVASIRSYYTEFRSSGSYLVSGFCKGIEENTYRVKSRARIMAREAANAARRELQERSPSKVFYKIGAFAGEGFVNALADYDRTSYKAGSQLASEAKSGLSRAISKVTDVINSDMDTQPTIRPVLDLSDVSSGVGAINGMFGMTPSVGVMSNIGAISSMMNGRQNGGNDDVISAIKDLGSKIGNTSGNTYTINGVNYSDDTEVANAFKTIIRAAKVERRA